MKRYHYKTLICENGHIFKSDLKDLENEEFEFCTECSAKLISSCLKCNKDIPGKEYEILQTRNTKFCGNSSEFEIETLGDFIKPAYCPYCGEEFPWTKELLVAGTEILDKLSIAQRQIENLKETFPDLLVRTPKSELVALKYNEALSKVPRELLEGFIILLKREVPPAILAIVLQGI